MKQHSKGEHAFSLCLEQWAKNLKVLLDSIKVHYIFEGKSVIEEVNRSEDPEVDFYLFM